MNIMKKYILFLIVSVFVFNTFAQDSEEKDQPVSSTFESGYLIDNQTIFIPDAKTLEFVIQHKFGTMDQGFSDLFGIYAPGSNIRLGLNYVPESTDATRISVCGFEFTRGVLQEAKRLGRTEDG